MGNNDYKARRRADGLCVECGNESETYRCPACNERRNSRRRDRRRAIRPKAAKPAVASSRRESWWTERLSWDDFSRRAYEQSGLERQRESSPGIGYSPYSLDLVKT